MLPCYGVLTALKSTVTAKNDHCKQQSLQGTATAKSSHCKEQPLQRVTAKKSHCEEKSHFIWNSSLHIQSFCLTCFHSLCDIYSDIFTLRSVKAPGCFLFQIQLVRPPAVADVKPCPYEGLISRSISPRWLVVCYPNVTQKTRFVPI